jgi:hypothetical protein
MIYARVGASLLAKSGGTANRLDLINGAGVRRRNASLRAQKTIARKLSLAADFAPY